MLLKRYGVKLAGAVRAALLDVPAPCCPVQRRLAASQLTGWGRLALFWTSARGRLATSQSCVHVAYGQCTWSRELQWEACLSALVTSQQQQTRHADGGATSRSSRQRVQLCKPADHTLALSSAHLLAVIFVLSALLEQCKAGRV